MKLSYEETMNRLESLVTRMENNELDIDQLSDALKESQTLIKHCREMLRKADEQIKRVLDEETQN